MAVQKIAGSGAEWCGNGMEQLRFNEKLRESAPKVMQHGNFSGRFFKEYSQSYVSLLEPVWLFRKGAILAQKLRFWS